MCRSGYVPSLYSFVSLCIFRKFVVTHSLYMLSQLTSPSPVFIISYQFTLFEKLINGNQIKTNCSNYIRTNLGRGIGQCATNSVTNIVNIISFRCLWESNATDEVRKQGIPFTTMSDTILRNNSSLNNLTHFIMKSKI